MNAKLNTVPTGYFIKEGDAHEETEITNSTSFT